MKHWLGKLISSWTWHDVLITALIFVITFAASLAIVSLILIKLPANHFSKSNKRKFLDQYPQGIRIAAIVGKNLLGAILVVLGIVLSIPGVPGQGVLTILLGIMLMDFPGKHRLEQNIVRRPKVRSAIDRMRYRFSKPPLILD